MKIDIMEEYIDFEGRDIRKTGKFIEIPNELIEKIDKLYKILTKKVSYTIKDTKETD